MSRRLARSGRAVRDVLPVALVAWLVFHGIRTELLERYLVPSRSMEPTLHGDEESGDVVLVDKTAWWSWRRGAPRMFDLVVVRNRWQQGGNHLVKRFVTVGPATVWLEAGDLFVRPLGELGDPRVVKHPLGHPDLRLTAFELDPAADDRSGLDFLQAAPEVWRAVDGRIVVEPRSADDLVAARAGLRDPQPERWLRGHLSTARAMDSSFLDARGKRVPGGRVEVRDVGLEFEAELGPGVAALHLVVELLEVRYALEYAVGGRVLLRRDADPPGAPFEAGPLPAAGRRFRLRFGHLDGRLFVIVDDRLAVWHAVDVPWSSPREAVLPGSWERPPANLLHLGVAGTGPLTMHRLRGFHDVHYEPVRGANPGGGFDLEPGQIFVLGDNSYDSSDSRDRANEPLELSDLVGRPIAILAPAERMRRF
jgi:signal peptidase I